MQISCGIVLALALTNVLCGIAFTGCNRSQQKQEAIRESVKQELQRYPRATLIDLYKFFFQGACGPGHLIQDREAALRYLERELQDSTITAAVLWQQVGYQNQYYRLGLALVKRGALSQAELFEAFVQSANAAATPSLEEWRQEWQIILRVIEDMQLALPGFEQDKTTLNEMLSRGKMVVHHSEIFASLYHPHYRIVSKSQFEKLKAKLQNPKSK